MILSLFHSYNYVKGKYYLKEQKIFDWKKKKILIELLNIPYENKYKKLYFIRIENILSKKKFSFKSKNSYYTKHNIKIFLDINYNILYKYVETKTDIPDKKKLFNLIKYNLQIQTIDVYDSTPFLKYNTIKTKKNLLDLKIFESNTYQKPKQKPIDILFYQFKNLVFDINKQEIYIKKKQEFTKLKYFLFLTDYYYDAVLYLSNYIKKNNYSYLIIIDTYIEYTIWHSCGLNNILYSKNYNKYSSLTHYEKLIFCSKKYEIFKDLKQKKSDPAILFDSCIFLSYEIDTLCIKDLINKYNFVYSTNFSDKIINNQIFNYMINTVFIKQFYNNLIKSNRLKIKYFKDSTKNKSKCVIKQNNFNFKQKENKELTKIINNNKICRICYNSFTKYNICQLGCSSFHYICVDCYKKLNNEKENKIACPFCLQKTTINKIFSNKKELIDNSFSKHIDTKILEFINLIKKEKEKNKKIFCLCESQKINLTKKILSLFNFEKIIIQSFEKIDCLNLQIQNYDLVGCVFLIIGDSKKHSFNINNIFKNKINKLCIYKFDF